MKKALFCIIIIMGLAIAQEMAPYCCAPPFVTTVVPPNILISLDNSGSMWDRAYASADLYMADTAKWYGLFKPDSMYRWASNRFVSDPTGPFPGNVLNWACMSRADIAKKVLTGGAGNANFPIFRLVGEGRGSWTVHYHRDATNYNTLSIYHSADVTYVSISATGANPPITTSIGNTPIRVDMPLTEYAGVLDQIGDKDNDEHWDDDAPIFGLWHYNYDRGGYIRDYLGDPDIVDLRNHINAVPCDTWTPLAENYFEILHYFSQNPNPHYYNGDYTPNAGGLHDPYYDKYGHTMVPCRKSFVLMITDGEPTMDNEIPSDDLGMPGCTNLRNYYDDGGSEQMLDDVCLYGHVNDLRPDTGTGWGNRELADDQSIECFVIFAFGSGSATLQKAAMCGGFEDLNGDLRPGPDTLEWDEDGDGLPDNYFEASNGWELEQAIMKAIMEMLERISSSSGVAVVSTGSKGGGSTCQSQFYPRRTFPSGEVLSWIGTCQSLWLDPYGLIREDTDPDAQLHLLDDYVIKMEWTGSNVEVTRYRDIFGNGDSLVQVGIPVAIENLQPIWDGGEILWRRDFNNRNILTFVDFNGDKIVGAGELITFDSTHATQLRPYLGLPTDSAANLVINYVRGKDYPGHRLRTADGDVWKLGDVINAGAIAIQKPVERYDFIYGDNSYIEYYDEYINRRQIVLVGGNDGMIHCFNGGIPDDVIGDTMIPMRYLPGGYQLGEELWAYVPYNLLPHLKWLKELAYCHVYYVDLKTYITDTRIFPEDINHPRGWGTLLIGGMRLGGIPIDNEIDTRTSSFFAIDITVPDNPVPLWEYTSPNLDLTVCYSSVVKVDSSWYLVFGTGPITCSGESDQNARVYVLDLATGDSLHSWIIPEMNSFITNIFGADWGLDYNVDRIYCGTCHADGLLPGGWGGKIYRILTHDNIDPSAWTLAEVFNMERPITGEGSIATDDYNNLWVYFGSGRFFSDVDEADTTTVQRYVGFREDTTHATTVAGLFDVTPVWIDTFGTVHGAGPIVDFDVLIDSVNGRKGWWRELTEPGERCLTTSLVFGGAVLFTSFVPTGDICSYGGQGNLWAIFYRTGTAYTDPFLSPDSIRHPEKIYLGPGMPSEPTLYVSSDMTKVFIQAGGGIVSPETGIPGLPKSGVVIWKGR